MTLCCWVDDTATLNRQRLAIEAFLRERLGLALHPNKTVLQRCTQGIDFLGSIVYPDHRPIRQRSVRWVPIRSLDVLGNQAANSTGSVTFSWRRYAPHSRCWKPLLR